MKSVTSQWTGNTIYYSDNYVFSSMNKKAVEWFEKEGIQSKETMTKPQLRQYECAGQLRTAEQLSNTERTI